MKILFTTLFCALFLFLSAQQKDTIKMEIKNVGSQINSPFPDYAPLISADGNNMIFTSPRPINEKDIIKGKPGTENVYVTYYDDKNGRWLVTFIVGPTINRPDVDNSAIALSNDGQRMLLYRGGNEQNANGDILESILTGEEWSDPVRLPEPINSDENETSASISPDGRTIYFVSDRKWGYGGRDIWYSTQDETGTWGEAINLGKLINSAEDEEGVFIHPNGKALFFSSKGHNTTGGFDIFMSVYDETTLTWAEPENLGYPINTAENEIYFVLQGNGKTGYYASSKPDGYGDLDIYSVTFMEDLMKKNTTLLKGRVINNTDTPLGSTVVLKNKGTDKLVGTFKSNKTTGKYLVSVPPGKKYEMVISTEGYKTDTISIDIPYKAGYQEILRDIILEAK
jgi:hypothetical protein